MAIQITCPRCNNETVRKNMVGIELWFCKSCGYDCTEEQPLIKEIGDHFITLDKLYYLEMVVEELRGLVIDENRRKKLRAFKELLGSLLHSKGDNLILRLQKEIEMLSMKKNEIVGEENGESDINELRM